MDNVPGVPGIGIKTAAQLINTFGDLDTLLARAGEIRQPKRRERLLDHADQARLSRRLVTLCADAPVVETLDDFGPLAPQAEALQSFLEENEFRSLLRRMRAEFGWQQQDAVPEPETPPVIDRRDYALVRTLADLEQWITRAGEAGRVAVDTETTGLDAMRAGLVGVSLSLTPGEACYIPLAHRPPAGELAGDIGEQIPLDAALAALKPLLEDPAVMKVGQNIKFDRLLLLRYGIRVAPTDDTMLMSFVLAAGRHGHGMDELAPRHLDIKPMPIKEIIGSGRSRITFDEAPLERACDYAAEDADITLRLDRVLKPQLVRDRMVSVYETLERPLIPVLTAMERRGRTPGPCGAGAPVAGFRRPSGRAGNGDSPARGPPVHHRLPQAVGGSAVR